MKRSTTGSRASSSSSPQHQSERSKLLAHDHQRLQELEGGNYTTPSASNRPPPGDALKSKGTVGLLWSKTKYYVPVMNWLPSYKLSYLPRDALAAFSVASVSIPQSISFATSLAQSSPLAGLFPTAIPGLVYACLGTSRHLNVAPGAPLSLLMGQAISAALHEKPNNPEEVITAIVTITTLQAGIFAFLIGLFRFGFIDVILSPALMRGFMTSIAVVIMVEQLIPMLGLNVLKNEQDPQSTVEKFMFLVREAPSNSTKSTTLISFGALFILLGIRYGKSWFKRYWFVTRFPEVLVVVILSTVFSWRFGWDQMGVEVLGDISINFGKTLFRIPLNDSTTRHIQRTTSTAVLITILGYLDSIVAAKQAATQYRYSISPNRELVALGAGNILSSFIPGSLPAYGSLTRTKLSGDVHAKTQMTSVIVSVFTLLVTFFLLQYLRYLPKCILATVILTVVFGLLSETPKDLKYYWKMRSWADFAVLGVTFIFAILWNVEVGVMASMLLSLLLIVHRAAVPRLSILGRISGTKEWKPLDESHISPEAFPGVLVVQVKDDLNFTNTARLKERLTRLELYGEESSHPGEEPSRDPADILIFDLEEMGDCDASAAKVFYDLLDSYKAKGTKLFITHLQPLALSVFERAGIIQLLGNAAFCETIEEAMEKIEQFEMGG